MNQLLDYWVSHPTKQVTWIDVGSKFVHMINMLKRLKSLRQDHINKPTKDSADEDWDVYEELKHYMGKANVVVKL